MLRAYDEPRAPFASIPVTAESMLLRACGNHATLFQKEPS